MKDVERPLVSAIIAAYNRPVELDRAIRSVLAQTYAPIEIIVVDDASPTDLAPTVEKYRSQGVRYHRSPTSLKPSGTRNLGVRLSTGSLLAFLDDDDEWLPEKIARQVEAFAAAPPTVGAIYTGRVRIQPGRRPTLVTPPTRPVEMDDLLAANIVGNTSAVMVRRDVFEELGGYDENLMTVEDWDLWIRIAQRYEITAVPDCLLNYHFAGTDNVSMKFKTVFRFHRKFIRKHCGLMSTRRQWGLHACRLAQHLMGAGRRRVATRLLLRAALCAPFERTVHRTLWRWFRTV